MSKLSFFVAGKPVPKARPRVMPNGHTYTPARTVAWEQTVGWTAKAAMYGRKPFQGPLSVSLGFNGARANADSDNLAKAVLDGMNRVVYDDDSQVMRLLVDRMPANDPYGPVRAGVHVQVSDA